MNKKITTTLSDGTKKEFDVIFTFKNENTVLRMKNKKPQNVVNLSPVMFGVFGKACKFPLLFPIN